jgi:magnesium-transporting ATPase (P-type)
VFLDEGMRVPADCILFDSFEVACDESLFSGNKRLVSKSTLTDSNLIDNPNPFLFSNSLVMQGQGKALVCCVGDNTCIGAKKEKMGFE